MLVDVPDRKVLSPERESDPFRSTDCKNLGFPETFQLAGGLPGGRGKANINLGHLRARDAADVPHAEAHGPAHHAQISVVKRGVGKSMTEGEPRREADPIFLVVTISHKKPLAVDSTREPSPREDGLELRFEISNAATPGSLPRPTT